MKLTLAHILLLALITHNIQAQAAIIREEKIAMDSYLFSDPDPVPEPGRIYPYFRFDGYTSNSIKKEWNMVILENEHIQVYVCPDIGGKIWGAIEKSTRQEFIYYNHVVKFRDIAMRGPWTSGGLEYNFGVIGHIPTCATPVDYQLEENDDGSVSCIIGALDLPSRTKWNIEIKLDPHKAYFETITSWFNNTKLPCSYYHWMNAAAKSSGNLEFIYPGSKYIGHGGESGEWPVENEIEINFYENNDFGLYKSYHVINSYADYFGGYWHEEDFGFGHQSTYDDKPGKKLWIWGLSDQGMIWEDLLTDTDGQYIEYQAGKLFNQAAYSSSFTPFKHKEFTPFDTQIMHEIWFPLKGTKGMVDASEKGVLNVVQNGNNIHIFISALQPLSSVLVVKSGREILKEEVLNLQTLQLYTSSLNIPHGEEFTVEVGNNLLYYSSEKNELQIDRPVKPFKDFNWESSYGLYNQALELEKQRMYDDALRKYLQCLETESGYLPALNKVAMEYFRNMKYSQASQYINQSLSIDTYDPEANFLYGLINHKLGNLNKAQSGFSIASASVQYRNAAYTELAIICLATNDYYNAIHYARKALSFNSYNITALEILAIAYRKTENPDLANRTIHRIGILDKTNHFSRFEQVIQNEKQLIDFSSNITNELKVETYLELAIKYYNYNCVDEASEVLKSAPDNPIVFLWRSHLDSINASALLDKAVFLSPAMVFPHRTETAEILESLVLSNSNWKLKYYLGLILWNKGLLSKAQELFIQCGDEPDYFAFYLGKAKLFENEKDVVFKSLIKARELNNTDWRAAYVLTNYYLENSNWKEALILSEPFSKEYPENPLLGLNYAKSLIRTERYSKCVKFLEAYEVLPFEGATVARDLYHEACIRSAVSFIRSEKSDQALYYAERAKEWPMNLGVGKPYEVDERLDDYIIAMAYTLSGNKKKAEVHYHKVADYCSSNQVNESSKLIFQLFALEKLGEKDEALQLLSDNIAQFHPNVYLKWVQKIYQQDLGKAEEIAKDIIESEKIIQPYDITYKDNGFSMVWDILKEDLWK